MANSSKRDARTADRAELAQKALVLRRAGATYEQIARELKLSNRSIAFKLVQGAIADIPREEAQECLSLELERLDAMLRGGLFEKARVGDLNAVDRVLRIMDRRARYLGLDSPEKREHSGTVSIDAAEMMAAAERMRERLSKAQDSGDSD